MHSIYIIPALAFVLSGCVTTSTANRQVSGTDELEKTRPVPPVQLAREAIAQAIAVKASRLGSTSLAGKNAIVEASISGPKHYTDFITRIESDVYCIKFTLKESLFRIDGKIDTYAHVGAYGGNVSVKVASPSATNWNGCLPDWGAFPELEKYNELRAKRTNIFGF